MGRPGSLPYLFDPYHWTKTFAQHNARLLYVPYVSPGFIDELDLGLPIEQTSATMEDTKALSLALNSLALHVAGLPAANVMCLSDTSSTSYNTLHTAYEVWADPGLPDGTTLLTQLAEVCSELPRVLVATRWGSCLRCSTLKNAINGSVNDTIAMPRPLPPCDGSCYPQSWATASSWATAVMPPSNCAISCPARPVAIMRRKLGSVRRVLAWRRQPD